MISIIVPVYKAEKYIHRCIDSILAQSHSDFELLLIDDGSPDNCGAICDEYATMDRRVRVFHKVNGGVSSARNLGLDHAQGEWITFVDVDDYLHSDYLSSLYAMNDADMVVGSFQLVGSDEKWDVVLEDRFYDRKLFGDGIFDLLIKVNFQTPWGKLFKHSLLNAHHLRFDEEMIANEDFLFVLNYLIYVQSLRTCKASGYYYERGNLDGLSQNFRHFYPYFYGMETFKRMTDVMVQHFGNSVRPIYYIVVRAFCIRQCYYLYYSDEKLFSKFKKLRQMRANKHLKFLFSTTEIYGRVRRRTKIFHFMMSHHLQFFAYIYLNMLKGQVYD